MDKMRKANRQYWDTLAPGWESLRDQDQQWRRCPQEPELAFAGQALDLIRRYAGDLHGKHALVIGSGDNYAAFALAGMGAQVVSSDISSRQLEIAQKRAIELGLDMEFIWADAVELIGIPDSSFDLVCSSNGFYVWIPDPLRVFRQVERVLKPAGFYIFYDIHPFQRPWRDQLVPIEMEKPYGETGPFEYEENGMPGYEFHWRMSDLLNPMLEAGLQLREIAGSPAQDSRFWEGHAYTPGQKPELMDWRVNPRAGLPVWLTVVAQKPV